jgi:hypothetical protein
MPGSSTSEWEMAPAGPGESVEGVCGSGGSAGSSACSRCGELNGAKLKSVHAGNSKRKTSVGQFTFPRCRFIEVPGRARIGARIMIRTLPSDGARRLDRGCLIEVALSMLPAKNAISNRIATRTLSRGARNSMANPCCLCYPFLVHQEFHPRSFQFLVSTHEFFRLLSYTASYF